MPPIVFSRTASLSVAGPSLSLGSIPATAEHLMFHVAARLDSVALDDRFLRLRINADATAQYDGNTSKGTTGGLTTGVGGDGLNQDGWRVADLTTSDATAGLFTEAWGILPRYATAEFHTALWLAHTIDGPAATDLHRHFGAGVNDFVAATVASLDVSAEGGADLAPGTTVTVWGLGNDGDVTPTSIARSTQVGTAIDFLGDEFKDFSANPGANNFTATNPTLGRTISVNVSGGDGTTTIGFPAGTEVLEDTYVAGADAWLMIRCTDEVGPGFVATLKDVV